MQDRGKMTEYICGHKNLYIIAIQGAIQGVFKNNHYNLSSQRIMCIYEHVITMLTLF